MPALTACLVVSLLDISIVDADSDFRFACAKQIQQFFTGYRLREVGAPLPGVGAVTLQLRLGEWEFYLRRRVIGCSVAVRAAAPIARAGCDS